MSAYYRPQALKVVPPVQDTAVLGSVPTAPRVADANHLLDDLPSACHLKVLLPMMGTW